MLLAFFFLLYHLFFPLHFLYRLHLFHHLLLFFHLTKRWPYLALLLPVNLNSAIYRHLPSCVMCGSMHLIWIRHVLQTCVQAVRRLPTVIFTTCCATQMLGPGSNVGCTVVIVECLCRVLSDPRLIVPSVAPTKTLNMTNIC